MDPATPDHPRRRLLQARQLLPYDADELARIIDADAAERSTDDDAPPPTDADPAA